ncbi:MAG: type II toxin-antitoxin system CcdA family antitoxin [Candidatus Nezhaarchaeales archaeon]
MSKYVTVSIKVRRELKEEAERLGVNVSEVLKRALEDAVERKRIEILKRRLDEVSHVLKKIDIESIVRSIREDRESR